MYNQGNQNFNYQNPPNQQTYEAPQYNQHSNHGQPNSNKAHFPIENSSQQKSQSYYGQSSQNHSTGLSCNYSSSNKNNSKIKLISRGQGISEKEYDAIVSSCIQIQDTKRPPPLSFICINKIKEKIGGEWFVFVHSESESNYDYYLSYIKREKSLCFTYLGNEYDICRIR